MATNAALKITRTIEFPKTHLQRARQLKATFRITFAQIVRDGTERVLTELEERERNVERRKIELTEKRMGKRAGVKRVIGGALGPLPFSQLPPETPRRMSDLTSADDELYERAARTLLGVTEISEAKKRAKSAVELVQSERRITAPSEPEILARLEENLRRLREERAPDTRSMEDLVHTVIDVDKVKTVGEPIE